MCFAGGISNVGTTLSRSQGGGDTKIGNMVPACGACDDSKQNNNFEEWMTGNAPKSPRARGISDLESRIDKIKRYASEYGYTPRQPSDRLCESELRQFETLNEDLEKLRKRIEAFIEDKKAPSNLPNWLSCDALLLMAPSTTLRRRTSGERRYRKPAGCCGPVESSSGWASISSPASSTVWSTAGSTTLSSSTSWSETWKEANTATPLPKTISPPPISTVLKS